MREFNLLADERCAEALSDFLLDLGALSASIEDADADQPDEQPLYGEPGLEPQTQAWPRSIVSALVEDDFDMEAALAEAAAAVDSLDAKILSSAPVEDQDWVRITQAQFPPTQVSPRLWIVPSWHEAPDGSAINLRLDPGVAFGTGSHPTTHLCLEWLDAHVRPGDAVLDYGCGTGILAIAAKLLGAGEAFGTDIDPQAVEAARFNAKENGVEARFELPKDLEPESKADIVVANILANPLKLLAPALIGRMKHDGQLVLSGVLAKQAEEVIAVYEKAAPGLKLSVWKQREDWVCISGGFNA